MMGTWKVRKLRKGLRASHESGRKKGLVPQLGQELVRNLRERTKRIRTILGGLR